MTQEHYFLNPRQVDELLQQLQRFHAEHTEVAALQDPERHPLPLQAFRRFLERFLEDTENARQAAEELVESYRRANIPFVLLLAAFNHLKEAMVEAIASNTGNLLAHYREIDQRFEKAKRLLAQRQLLHAAAQPLPLPQRVVRDKHLIRLYLEWLQRLNDAILQDDLDAYPLPDPQNDPFTRALRHPESLFICLDLKLCDQIQEHHRLIQQQSALVHTLLAAERYDQAQLAHQELEKRVADLLNLLSALYFESQTNRLHRFFNFLQALLYLPGRKILAVVNPRGLRQLNQRQGSEAGNRALARIEERLAELCQTQRERLLYTRGIAGDFYLIGYHTTPEELDGWLHTLRQRLRHDDAADVPLDLAYHGLELTRIHQLSEENMPFLVDYLSERSRQENAIASGEAAAEAMLAWMRRRYRQSVDLNEKLEHGEVDIHIQPLVTLDQRRRIHAFEVLGRIREEDGELNAGLFIDDILRLGLAPRFDTLVLRALARHADDLRHITPRLFINVAAASLEDPAYLEALRTLLEGPLAGIEVVLELTEQVILERLSRVHELHRRWGIHFAIDDFGTGYSTLQTVIQLALDGGVRYLKLDGSLTRHLHDHPANERVMHITRQMARELELETVVEFIETPQQLHTLEAMRMDLGQGFLLGLPDPIPVWRGKLTYLHTRHGANGTDGFTL